MKTFEYSLESQLKKIRPVVTFNLNRLLTFQNYNVRILKENILLNPDYVDSEFEKLKKTKIRKFFSKWSDDNFSRDKIIEKIDDNLSLMNLFSSKNIIKIEKIENKIYILIYKIESIGQGVASLHETTPKTTCITYKFIITEIN